MISHTSIRLYALALAAAVLAATAQPSHATENVSEARSVAAFQAIAVQGSIDLSVRQGEQSVQVHARSDVLPLVETVVQGSGESATLQIRVRRSHALAPGRIGVEVVVPRLTAVSGAGSGTVRIESFSTPSLAVKLAGSGDGTVTGLNAGELKVSLAGSADFQGDGQAGRLDLGIAGSSDARLGGLRADDVVVRISGSGDATLNAQRTLAVRIAGSGDVVYSGDAAVTTSIAGSGSVKKR